MSHKFGVATLQSRPRIFDVYDRLWVNVIKI